MLSETQFRTLAADTLARLQHSLEPAYERGDIEDIELVPGILTITMADGKIFVVSAHAPTGELWLASPLSGGLHFRWENESWKLPGGEALGTVLARDLKLMVEL